jgi:CBS domain-containing protein
MATTQIELESQVTELAAQAFKTFCDDISSMFGVYSKCEQREISSNTVSGLQKQFQNLVAVNVIDSKGFMDGTFQFILDQGGLFTLGGIIIKLPEETIVSNRQNASAEIAESMTHAIGELGNLLANSCNKVFNEKLEGHNHFWQRPPAFVGKPWDKTEKTMRLAGDEEVSFLPYKMTLGSYSPFNCGIIFPKTIFADNPDFMPEENTLEEGEQSDSEIQTTTEKIDSQESNEETIIVEENNDKEFKQKLQSVEETFTEILNTHKIKKDAQAGHEPEDIADPNEADVSSDQENITQDPNAPTDSIDSEESDKEPDTVEGSDGKESSPQEPAVEDIFAGQTAAIEDAAQAFTEKERIDEKATDDQKGAAEQQSEAFAEQKDTAPDGDLADNITEEKAPATEQSIESATSGISETIQKMVQSSVVLPGDSGRSAVAKKAVFSGTGELLCIFAKDIMQKDIVWAGPDESVQQALKKMQQHDAGYIMVGRDRVLEGIVSKSDIAGAVSPYLRSIFAKWRRILDDATLKIKIKWIMSRPVRTIRPETSLVTIMDIMCRFGGRALPVVDKQGEVLGLVTVFDIFRILLDAGADFSIVGKTAQGPPLL